LETSNRTPHFDVSAALIRQLGEELVSDEVTAMMELIKNSYDADADWVSVEINVNDSFPNDNTFYKDSLPGYIKIEDNGVGMSDDDIWNSWMKISLSAKKKFKSDGLFTIKGRTPLGEKGVGRLSTNKLGNRLELFTGQERSKTENHVAFDWSSFEDDISLTSVPVHIDQLPKELNKKGTILVITNLREPEKWTGKAWDNFRGQISQMIFPFKENRVFNVFLKINGQTIDLDELNENVRKSSVSSYDFSVLDNKVTLRGKVKLQKLNGSNNRDQISFYEKNILPDLGKDFFSYLTDTVANKSNYINNVNYSGEQGTFFTFDKEIDFETLDKLAMIVDEDQLRVAHPGNFYGEIDDFYFQDSDLISNAFSSVAEFKRIVQNQVGIRIFRDGFGIKPYGINGLDWLNLSGSQTSGSSYYGLRPKNVIGFVAISAFGNKNLKEKTDREGFTDNPYSRNFKRIMDYFIDQIDDILESTRRSYNDYRSKIGQEAVGINDIADSFEKLKKSSVKAKKIGKKAKEVKQHLLNVAARVKAVSENQSRRKVPEDDEQVILLNEITALLSEGQQLLEQVEEILDETNKLDQYVEFLQPQIQRLEEQLSDFAELAGLGLTAEALSHELSNIVDRIVEETDRITKRIKGNATISSTNVNIYIEYIRNATKSFRKQLSHIAPSLRYVRENKEKISVKGFLSEISDFYSFSDGIEIDSRIDGADFSIKINKGKLTQIIDNIILNSEYWLRERKRIYPDFAPKIHIVASEPFIRISDNGIGIDPSVQDRIFQPFVTNKPKNVGRGLGLFIVQQLLDTINGEILLLSEKNQYGNRYIFQINFSSAIE